MAGHSSYDDNKQRLQRSICRPPQSTLGGTYRSLCGTHAFVRAATPRHAKFWVVVTTKRSDIPSRLRCAGEAFYHAITVQAWPTEMFTHCWSVRSDVGSKSQYEHSSVLIVVSGA